MTTPVYSLDILWNFTDNQILQILQYFGNPVSDQQTNRLNAIVLSFNNNLLIDEDRKYLSSPEFSKLLTANDTQLKILAQERGLIQDLNHIGMLKYIIDNINAPVVSIVTSIPNNPSGLYRMIDNLYLCGSGTYNIKEQLKSLGGVWNPPTKCWMFPLSARDQLLSLIIPSNIPTITQVPTIIPGDLQIYQRNNQVLVCGKRTYNIKDKLLSLNGKFDRNVGCWILAPEQANAALAVVSEVYQQDILESQQRQLLKQRTQQEAQRKAEERSAREARLRMYEPESNFIPHLNRLSPSVIENARLNNTYNDLYYAMMQQDINELRPLWDDKIQIISRKPDIIVTYTGDIKPPNDAMAYKVNSWQPLPMGFLITRIDYKTYKVTIFGTD